MKYFLDTEFIERGNEYPLTLISIGIVAEDGREYYAEANGWERSDCNNFVLQNVLPHLQWEESEQLPTDLIADQILDFVGTDTPEFWLYYGAYDWVILCQLFGAMVNLPKGWPMFYSDLVHWKTLVEFPKQEGVEHHALADARWNKLVYDKIMTGKG